jgi:hypothetical protein
MANVEILYGKAGTRIEKGQAVYLNKDDGKIYGINTDEFKEGEYIYLFDDELVLRSNICSDASMEHWVEVFAEENLPNGSIVFVEDGKVKKLHVSGIKVQVLVVRGNFSKGDKMMFDPSRRNTNDLLVC